MQNDVVQLTQQLLALNTINPPGSEEPCIKLIESWLKELGLDVELHYFAPNRCNLLAKTPGTFKHYLTFTGHVDTVPLGLQKWRFSPWGEDINQGRLYGRGSSDMKGAIAAFIIALSRALDAGLTQGVMLLITGGEETGCEGAKALLKERAIAPVSSLIVGESTDNQPVIGHKGALWLRCQSYGVTAHGAMPHLGDNAIYKTASAIHKIQSFEVGPSHAIMAEPTLNVGRVEGGININSVPDKSQFDVDIRTHPELNHAQIKQRLCQHLGEQVEIESLMDLPAVLTQTSDPWLHEVRKICEQHNHKSSPEKQIVSYFSDASVLMQALNHPPCVILGPGSPDQAHQTDEYCLLENLYKSCDIYQAIISQS